MIDEKKIRLTFPTFPEDKRYGPQDQEYHR